MANTKITERALYMSILNDEVDMETLKAFAEKKIAQLDKRNASAKARSERKRAESSDVIEAVFALVGAEPQTRDEIANAYGDESMSVAKIGAKLNALVSAGRIEKTTIKVTGADGKVSNKVGYYVQ